MTEWEGIGEVHKITTFLTKGSYSDHYKNFLEA